MEKPVEAWLLLAYSLPTEPSRFRVSVWRRLRKLGAIYLNEGFWVLPNSAAMVKEIEGVIKEVHSFQGTASAFTSRDLDPGQGERLRSKFLDARKEEYSELQGQYEKFVVHVEHARATQRFTFAEVEELEEELAKLERWLREIGDRDVFKSPENARTAQALEQGRMLLQRFTEDTFAASSDSQLAANPDPNGASAGT